MDNENKKQPLTIRFLFGVLMAIIYLGMGVLMLINFFNWTTPWTYYSLGVLFILYGIYRAWRQIKGKGYN